MKKKIWLTSLIKAEEAVSGVMGTLSRYGLEVQGHFWEDDLEQMGWAKPRAELLDDGVKMWCILASPQPLQEASIRYGLSMLALSLQAVRGTLFPLVVLQAGEEGIAMEDLPLLFENSTILPLKGGSYGAKIVAALHKTTPASYPPYRLDVYGIPKIGQWFEVGPREGTWKGVIFATSGGTITAHGVGKSGQLPESCVLNYAQKGLRLEVGEREYEGWAVQNELDGDTSYYVKVDGNPEAVMFCPYSQDDETEAFILDLV